MQDLTPAGLTEDGTCLLLVTARGERFLLPIDDQLQRLVGRSRLGSTGTAPASATEAVAETDEDPRAAPAAGADTPATPATPTTPTPSHARTARSSQKQEPPMESALRPRDIQARIRGGESAETVAAAAGTSVEAIMPFAAPVLAERAHQAQSALRASLRRGGGSGARTLGEAVDQFLADHRLQEDDVAWDSWRRPDGRWALTATVEVDGRTREAEFLHDVAGRYVVTQNDDAAVLTGTGGADAPAAAEPARRLSAVGDAPRAGGDLGDDAIAMVRDRHEPAVLDAPARSSAPEPELEPVVEEPVVEEPAAEEPVAEPAPEAPAAEVSESAAAEADDDQPELDLGQPAQQPGQESGQQTQRKGRRGRSSVPSWDEIMFGGGSSKE